MVITVMVFLDDPHLYSAWPFVISGTCKCEDVNSQQKLLETACTVVHQKLWDGGLWLYSIASDGDSQWWLATADLTLIQEIAPDSELQSQLRDLALFNYLCGAYDVTADINYKHLIKLSNDFAIPIFAHSAFHFLALTLSEVSLAKFRLFKAMIQMWISSS